jgi:mannan endo-1,4-beta-mannosidase
MKAIFTLALGLLSAAYALPSTRAAAAATVNGTRFSIDGKTGYFAGTNSYWIGFLTNNKDVDTVLDHISSSGLKILRVWGFNDVNTKPGAGMVWFQLLSGSSSQINTGADGLQRLDYVVQSAEKRGVKLIINFVNYWDDYGGINAYVKAFGGTKESWYTNTRAQDQYKKYIQAVVSRYSKSNAVFAWELANEPRCKGCNTDVIYKWATDISAYIRSLDSNHMITLGDEGFGLPGDTTYPYQYGEGTDFVKNLRIKNLDFGTFHMYPDSCAYPFIFAQPIPKRANVNRGRPIQLRRRLDQEPRGSLQSRRQALSLGRMSVHPLSLLPPIPTTKHTTNHPETISRRRQRPLRHPKAVAAGLSRPGRQRHGGRPLLAVG